MGSSLFNIARSVPDDLGGLLPQQYVRTENRGFALFRKLNDCVITLEMLFTDIRGRDFRETCIFQCCNGIGGAH